MATHICELSLKVKRIQAFLHAISWGNSCQVSISNEILPLNLNDYLFCEILIICSQEYV